MFKKKKTDDSRMRRYRFSLLLPAMLLLLSCQNPSAGTGQNRQAEESGENGASKSGELQVHFIDVGQSDASLILCEGHAMLFDTGENETSPLLQFYLMEMGVEKLDYVIGSHPEADHIGGMDAILLKYDCGTVMLSEISPDTASYRDVQEAMERRGVTRVSPEPGEQYPLGGAFFTIIAPNRDYGENMNNASIGIKLVYGENAFIFTGDGEREAEEDMLKNGIPLNADVLQAGHHGSSDASTEAFVEAVSPRYAVISCGKDNAYGHPHRETLETFQEAGVEVFRTDLQGNIVALSDGRNLTWHFNPAPSWDEIYYVGNKSNGKLHVSTCLSLPKEWNQIIFSSREEAVRAGFSDLCGGCF